MPSNHHFPVPILCHSSNKSVKYLSLCTCTENQIYISENYTGEMRKREEKKNEKLRHLLDGKLHSSLYCMNVTNIIQPFSVCISNSASSSYIFSSHFMSSFLLSSLYFALLCCASSSSSSRFPFNE